MFHVGQKVICVDDSPSNSPHLPIHPVRKGEIYVIDGIDPETGTGLYLQGMPEPVYAPWGYPIGWRPSRFRPVIERKTDISIFTAMLTPSKETV